MKFRFNSCIYPAFTNSYGKIQIPEYPSSYGRLRDVFDTKMGKIIKLLEIKHYTFIYILFPVISLFFSYYNVKNVF